MTGRDVRALGKGVRATVALGYSFCKRHGGIGGARHMENEKREISELQDRRPVEVREGQKPQSTEESEEDIADASTVENLGY